MKLTCVGDVGVDLFLEEGGHESIFPGGCSLNVALHARRILNDQSTVTIVSAIGEDSAGNQLCSLLAREKIISAIEQLPGITPCQKIRIKNGERFFVGYEQGVLPQLPFTIKQRSAIEEADITVTVLFHQIETVFDRLLTVPRRGLLAVDFMNLSDYGYSTAKVRTYAPRLDVAFAGLRKNEDASLIDELQQIAAEYNRLIIVTLGAHGVRAFPGSLSPIHVNAVPVPSERVVDTTGAGDSFIAAFLSHWRPGGPLEPALDAACAHAARTIGYQGATPVTFDDPDDI